jgi:hypothetical protein
MALEHRCVSHGDPSTYTLIRIATCARTSVRADTSAAPPRATAAHASATDRAQSAAVRAGPRAAHTKDKPVTEAVFHAPMFALKADADWNTCIQHTCVYIYIYIYTCVCMGEAPTHTPAHA